MNKWYDHHYQQQIICLWQTIIQLEGVKRASSELIYLLARLPGNRQNSASNSFQRSSREPFLIYSRSKQHLKRQHKTHLILYLSPADCFSGLRGREKADVYYDYYCIYSSHNFNLYLPARRSAFAWPGSPGLRGVGIDGKVSLITLLNLRRVAYAGGQEILSRRTTKKCAAASSVRGRSPSSLRRPSSNQTPAERCLAQGTGWN